MNKSLDMRRAVCFTAAWLAAFSIQRTDAFPIVMQQPRPKPSFFPRTSKTSLGDTASTQDPESTETFRVTDIEEAMEVLEEYVLDDEPLEDEDDEEEAVEVVLQDLADDCEIRDYSKEELTSDIEDVVLQLMESQVDEPDVRFGVFQEHKASISSMTSSPSLPSTEQPSADEAVVSASLYMNPATAKIASHLTITWEVDVAETLNQLASIRNPSRPLMIGVVGIPGSGKSTSAEIVATLLNSRGTSSDDESEEDDGRAIVMPMDGFHLPLETLAMQPNAADVIYRRGAPDTFDPSALQDHLQRIVYGDEPTVTLPGFDHAKGDPVADQYTFDRSVHEIVLCEGIYLLHDADGWQNVRQYLDWTIYIDANVENCIERLKERNLCIPGYTPEEIVERCDLVDRVNAELSRDSAKKYANQIVSSGAK